MTLTDFRKYRSALYATTVNSCTYVGLSVSGDIPRVHSEHCGVISADRTSFGDLLYSHIFCTIDKESGFSMESTAILSLLLGFAMGEFWKMSDYTPRVNRLCNKSLQFDALDAPSIEDLTTFVCHFFGEKLKCELPAFEHAPTPIDLRLATFPDNTPTHYPEPSSQRQ
jgi:hypothetical protein